MNVSLTCKDCGEQVHLNEDVTKWYEYSPSLEKCVLTNITSHQMIMNKYAKVFERLAKT